MNDHDNISSNETTEPRDDNMVYPEKCRVSPGIATLLSFILVGLGQMVNGQLQKGLIMMVVAMVILGFAHKGAAPFLWIISAIDAYLCAKKLKSGTPIGKFSFF